MSSAFRDISLRLFTFGVRGVSLRALAGAVAFAAILFVLKRRNTTSLKELKRGMKFTGVSCNFLRLIVCVLAILAIVSAPPAWSQATSTSTITGQVTDQSNASVAGAEVRVIDTATGSAQTVLTNDTGRYIFVNLSSGTYDLTVSKTGFT